MPEVYPALPPTLSNDNLQISRFLQSPTAIRRRLRDYRDLRFISDQVLTGRLRSSGGAVLFEQSEPFLNQRTVESVSPGQPYPKSDTQTGTAGLAEVSKWGQAVDLTDEEIDRNIYGGQIVDRKLKKTVNSVIAQVDSVSQRANFVFTPPVPGITRSSIVALPFACVWMLTPAGMFAAERRVELKNPGYCSRRVMFFAGTPIAIIASTNGMMSSLFVANWAETAIPLTFTQTMSSHSCSGPPMNTCACGPIQTMSPPRALTCLNAVMP